MRKKAKTFTLFQKFVIVLFVVAIAGAAFVVFRVSGGTTASITLSTQPTLETGLVGHWTFDGKDIDPERAFELRDRSGNGHHGSWRDHATTTVPGRIGQAIWFDGVDDDVGINDTAGELDAIDAGGTALTVSLWFNLDEIPAAIQATAGKYDTAGSPFTAEREFRLYVDTVNHCWTVQEDPNAFNEVHKICDPTPIQAGTWYHAVGTFKGGEYMRLYADGVLVAEQTGDVPSRFANTDEPFVIAASGNGVDQPFKGKVDDVRLYDRALSADEIKRLHQLGGTANLNTTINTQSATEGGLVGHWTMDGKDTVGSAGGDWYQDYAYRRAVTINASQVATTSVSYPVLATTTLGDLKYTGAGGKIETLAGNDLVWVDDDHTTLLAFEVESHSTTTGAIVHWINTDISSTTDKTIYMYYGKAGDTNHENPTAVWPSYYKGVWHLAEVPTVSTDCAGGAGTFEACDSTGNNNDMNASGFTAGDQVSGQVNGSLDFVNDRLTFSEADFFDVPRTYFAWIYPRTSGGSGFGHVFGQNSLVSMCDGDGDGECASRNNTLEYYQVYSGDDGIWYAPANSITLNAWNHIMVTYDGSSVSNDPAFFINGQSVAVTEGQAPTGTVLDADADLSIGQFSSGGGFSFDGLIDEARIATDVLLTAADALTQYAMTADNTSVLTVGSEETSVVTTVTDRSGQGNTGTVEGALTASGRIGQAFRFDGVDDVLSMGSPDDLDDIWQNGGTVSAWIRPDSEGETAGRVFERSNWRLFVDSDTGTHVGIRFSHSFTTTNGLWRYPVTVPRGGWTHIAVTYDRAGTENDPTVYYNGQAVGLDSEDSPVGTPEVFTTPDFLIGNNSAGDRAFDGRIDEMRVYDEILASDEIKRIYKLGATTKINTSVNTVPALESGLVGHWTFDGGDIASTTATRSAIDRSGQGNNGTMSSNPLAAPGRVRQGLKFDGSDDSVFVSDSSSINPATGTFGLWFNAANLTQDDTQFISTEDAGGYALGLNWDLDLGCNNNAVQLLVRVGGTYYCANYATSNLESGAWYHMAGTYDGETLILYVNGDPVASNGTPSGNISYSATNNLCIGREVNSSCNNSAVFSGILDDIRIYNRVLSAEEITQLYRLGGN